MNYPDINVFKMFINAGFMVQLVLALLMLFSITSWAIILVKMRYIGKALKESSLFLGLLVSNSCRRGLWARPLERTSRAEAATVG